MVGELPQSGPIPAMRTGGQVAGFLAVAKGFPAANVIKFDSKNTLDESFAQMNNILNRIPDGVPIMMTAINDQATTGMLRAVKLANREQDALAVGMGADEVETLASEDRFIASVGYFPENYGNYLIAIGLAELAGKTVPPAVAGQPRDGQQGQHLRLLPRGQLQLQRAGDLRPGLSCGGLPRPPRQAARGPLPAGHDRPDPGQLGQARPEAAAWATEGGARGALAMRGMAKSFGGLRVLDGVDFEIAAGEIVALLGSNGAGKSTLVKILTGTYEADAGEVELDGAPLAAADQRAAIAAGISIIPQELSALPDLTVAENICVGDLPVRGPLRRLDRAAMRARAAELLAELGVGSDVIDPDAVVGRLPVARQRVVEIARALAAKARYLVMDEPTASLPAAESERLYAVTRRLAASGVGVVYISHYLDEVCALCDRIVVLRDGRVAGRFELPGTSQEEIIQAMLGAAVANPYGPAGGGGGAVPPLLEVADLSVPRQLHGVSFAVGAGEIVGMHGLVGSGIECVARALAGAVPSAGTVTLGGEPCRPRGVAEAQARGVALVAAERKEEGIVADLTVGANISLPFLGRFTRWLRLDKEAEEADARRWIEHLGIRCRGPRQPVAQLSGGNQQKACLARWLAGGVKLLLCEEPTRGVDIGSRRDLYAELRRLAGAGIGVLLISSDVEEVAGVADRSVVLRDGRVGAEHPGGTPAEVLAAAAMAAAR